MTREVWDVEGSTSRSDPSRDKCLFVFFGVWGHQKCPLSEKLAEVCVQNCAHKVFKCLKGRKIRGSRTSKWNSFHSTSTIFFSIKVFLPLFLPLNFSPYTWYQINRVLYNTMILLKMLSAFHMLCMYMLLQAQKENTKHSIPSHLIKRTLHFSNRGLISSLNDVK